ncbi:hypothetical protein DVH05_006880 [Phytophthora capsici]|nr:hypothetical protein DVH05_006880 [Phytophthora capsici]
MISNVTKAFLRLLGKKVFLRCPGKKAGERKKTRRELKLHGDEADDEGITGNGGNSDGGWYCLRHRLMVS